MFTVENYYRCYIKFCPECGKELELDPITNLLACFLHGDFSICIRDSDEKIEWKFTRNLIKRDI